MKRLIRILSNLIKSLFYTKDEKRHSLVGPANLWQMKRQFQINFLKKQDLKPQHYLLDIGCGTLRGGIPIISYLEKGHYYGIEVRENVLEEGRKELKECDLENKEPNLISAKDIATIKLNVEFDYIWAFSVLIHMEDNVVDKCLKMVSENLRNTGAFYANVNIGKRLDGRWREFKFVWREMDFYKNLAAKNELLAEDLGTLRSLGHVTNVTEQDEGRMLKFCKK